MSFCLLALIALIEGSQNRQFTEVIVVAYTDVDSIAENSYLLVIYHV